MRLRLGLYGSLALAVGLGVTGEASAAIGPSSTHAYAGVSSSTQATGIDGYMRKSGTTDFFGVSNSLGADISFGLHVHTSSGWLLWTAVNVPSSGGWSDSPPYRTNLATFYSFKVTD